jgi:2-polyprenyl-3-methyl-5-hydroxy-6-metoxy-1,4-benzoquinol methylase
MTTAGRAVRAAELFVGSAHVDKYHSGNWIADKLITNFMQAIVDSVLACGSEDVHEIGCGEGHIMGLLAARGLSVRGSDVSEQSLSVARAEILKRGLSIPLANKSVYDLDPAVDSADIVMCCEVLEHLTDPEIALRNLVAITKRDLILSVPHEPLWHILNMVRGKYLTALGNTPGHYQHWTKRGFVKFVSQYADIVSVRTPIPWTLIRCRPRSKAKLEESGLS